MDQIKENATLQYLFKLKISRVKMRDFKKMFVSAGGYVKNATLFTLTGLGAIWLGKKVAEKTPIEIDEDILDELTGDA